jgi:hypothetical protein
MAIIAFQLCSHRWITYVATRMSGEARRSRSTS